MKSDWVKQSLLQLAYSCVEKPSVFFLLSFFIFQLLFLTFYTQQATPVMWTLLRLPSTLWVYFSILYLINHMSILCDFFYK